MADPLDILYGRPSRGSEDDIAPTLANIASVIASIPERRARAAQQRATLERTELEAYNEQLKAQDMQRKVQDLQAIDQAWQSGNRDQFLARLPGHLQVATRKGLADLDEADAKRKKALEEARKITDDSIARTLQFVAGTGYDPHIAQASLSELKQRYKDDPQLLQQFGLIEKAIQENPTAEHVKFFTDALIRRSEEQRKADEDAQKAKTAEALSQQKLTGTEPIQPVEQARIDAQKEQAAATLAATEAQRKESNAIARGHLAVAQAKEAREAANEGATPDLTPEAIDAVALSFAKTGQLPPMGMGKQATALRTEIINRAAQMNPSLDLASNRAAFQANEGALKQLQKQRDAIGAFENTAQKNIDVFLKEAGKVVDTGSPLANQLVRNVSGGLLGSPDVAAYNAARQVAINEIAKITSNPNLSGQLSDTARKEVEAFNPASATLKQSVEVMRLLKQDMKNRTDALDAQIGAIRERIKSGGKSQPEHSKRIKVTFDKDGNLVRQ